MAVLGLFMDIKLKCIEKLTDKAEVREALAKNKLRTKMQEWDFLFHYPGRGAGCAANFLYT